MLNKAEDYKKDYILNPTICAGENDKYLGSIINDSVVAWNEVIEPIKL